MNKRVILVLITLNTLFFLYMLGLKTLEENKVEMLKVRWKLTTEELNYAYSMLTSEERKKVYDKFKANDEFLKAIFPESGI